LFSKIGILNLQGCKDQQTQGRRPRFSLQKEVIRKNKIEPIFTGDIDKLESYYKILAKSIEDAEDLLKNKKNMNKNTETSNLDNDDIEIRLNENIVIEEETVKKVVVKKVAVKKVAVKKVAVKKVARNKTKDTLDDTTAKYEEP